MRYEGLRTISHRRKAWLVTVKVGSTVGAKLVLRRQWQPRLDFSDSDVQRGVVYEPIANDTTSFFDWHLRTDGSH